MPIGNYRIGGLATPPVEYDQRQQIQVVRALERYFNNIDTSQLFIGVADRLNSPSALLYSTESQTLAQDDTGQVITYNNTYYANRITIQDNSKVVAEVPGFYNFQLVAEIASQNANDTAYIWIAKNGQNVLYSGKRFIPNAEGAEIVWTFNIDLDVGQYIEMVFAGDNASAVELLYLAPNSEFTGFPGSASAVLSVNFVSPVDNTLITLPSV